MLEREIRRSLCTQCESRHMFDQFNNIKRKGATLRFGDVYCDYGRKIIKFKGKKGVQVPEWCPKRISPPEIKLYRLKDEESWFFHSMSPELPLANHYSVEKKGNTLITAKRLYEELNNGTPAMELLGFAVKEYDIISIDDGLNPCYFYKYKSHYWSIFFRPESAKKR